MTRAARACGDTSSDDPAERPPAGIQRIARGTAAALSAAFIVVAFGTPLYYPIHRFGMFAEPAEGAANSVAVLTDGGEYVFLLSIDCIACPGLTDAAWDAACAGSMPEEKLDPTQRAYVRSHAGDCLGGRAVTLIRRSHTLLPVGLHTTECPIARCTAVW